MVCKKMKGDIFLLIIFFSFFNFRKKVKKKNFFEKKNKIKKILLNFIVFDNRNHCFGTASQLKISS